MELRDYQVECLNCVESSYIKGINRQLICLPTGTGKTVIFCNLPKVMNMSCLVIVPRIELLNQTKRQFQKWLPERKISILHGADRDVSNITITTVQTAQNRTEIIKAFGFEMSIFDEAHHAVAKSYHEFLKSIDFLGDEKLLIGLTATPKRTDGSKLDKIFTKIVYQKTIPDMIGKGYLSPINGFSVKTKTDISSAIRNNPDSEKEDDIFDHKKLASVINTDIRNDLIVKTYVEHAQDRAKAIAFCADLDHAEALSKCFKKNDISSEFVSCYQGKRERSLILEKFRNGHIKVLCNRDILIEGFDEPSTDVILLCRPTASSLLYTQMIGRGTRIFPNKKDLLVIEFTDRVTSSISAKLMSLSRLNGDEPTQNSKEQEDKTAKTHFLFASDGSVVIENIDFNGLKLMHEQWEDWKTLPPTIKQLDFCKVLYGGDLPFNGAVTRQEISKYINNAKCTNSQRLKLLSYNIYSKDLTYGEAKERLDQVEPAINAQYLELEEIYPKQSFRDKGLTRLQAQLLIDNRPATDYQISLLTKYDVNPQGMTKSQASRVLSMIQDRLRMK